MRFFSQLADHIHFDLTRIFQIRFDLFGYITRHQNHGCIIHLIRHYHNSNLSACLNSKRFLYSLEGVRNIFQLF